MRASFVPLAPPPPGVPGSCLVPPGLVPAWFLVPLPETALCSPALTSLPACSVPTATVLPGPRGGLPAMLLLSEGTDEWFS